MLIPMERQIAEHGVRPRKVLHVGAHMGEEATAYRKAGVSEVWWVEANPAVAERLRNLVVRQETRARGGMRQHVIRAAVGAPSQRGETVPFHLADNGQSSSLLEPGTHLAHHGYVHFDQTIDVTIETLDHLAREHLIAADYLNLDIQGAELDALVGALEVVLPFARWVYSEVNTEQVYMGCAEFPELNGWLHLWGFDLVERVMSTGDVGWGDALWRRA